MILLSGHSLKAAREIPLESMSLSLKERESTATITPADMEGIGTESWFQDDTEPGKGIVWRVQSLQHQFAVDTQTVQLEHVINVLRDRILFGEVTPADMGGGDTCTAKQAAGYILKQQSDWVLGKFEFDVEGAWKFDGETLFDALAKVSDSLEDPWWSFDTTKYPFTLNIIKKPSGVVCEMRPGRNLSAVTRTIDKSGMYTRFYPIGKDDLHVSGDYVSRNEDKYGVICKTEVDQSLDTEAELRRRANARLRKHARPTVEIQAEGVELAEATGEKLDKLTLGRICRIPLAEFGDVIEERIVGLDYRDKVKQPENVRVTMSNKSDDAKPSILNVLAQEIKEGGGPSGRGGGGRGAAKQAKEDHAWFEDTDKHVAMCAEGIVGVDADGNPNWTRLSQIIVDENGIHNTVQGIQGDLVVAETAIEQNENEIKLEAKRAADAERELSASIKITSDMIESEVKDRKNGQNQLSSRITQQANKISLVVEERNGRNVIKTASIVSGINADHGSYIKLQADTINLSGYVTMSQLNATNATIANLMSGYATASKILASEIDVSILKVYGSRATWQLKKLSDGTYINYLGA